MIGCSDEAIIGLLLATAHPARVCSLASISANLDPSAFTHSAEGATKPHLDAPAPPQSPGEPRPDFERLKYERLTPDGPDHGDGPDHADVVLAKLLRR